MAKIPQYASEMITSRAEQLQELLALWKKAEGDTILNNYEVRLRLSRTISNERAHFRLPQDLTAMIEAMQEPDDDIRADVTIMLGKELLKVAQHGNVNKLKLFIDEKFPVNYQDPETSETVLHIAAGSRARKVLRLILSTGQCDFLLRDEQGRLASELAFLYGQDIAVAKLLGIKERKQGEAQGIKVTRRPRP